MDAAAVQINTDDANVGQTITERQVVDLPINTRNFQQLLTLGPGSSSSFDGNSLKNQNRKGAFGGVSGEYNIGGLRSSSNGFLLDGLANIDYAYVTVAVTISLDAIKEFSIQDKAYSAIFGGSANAINLITKSGTNSFHGTAYEFNRNTFANALGTVPAGSTNGKLNQNQFGYSFGGPVRIPYLYNGRDRTFFFANYEGLRIAQNQLNTNVIVPTLSNRMGQFKIPVIDPLTGVTFPLVNGFYTIPEARFSRLAKALLPYIPNPKGPTANADEGVNNFIGVIAKPTKANQQTYRIDQNLGRRDSIFVRATLTKTEIDNPQNLDPSGDQFVGISTNSYAGSEIHTFSPRIVNEARFGYLNPQYSGKGADVPSSVLSSLGVQNTFPNPPQQSLPFVSLNNGNSNSFAFVGGANNVPGVSDQPTYEVSDNLSWVRGRHAINIGMFYRHIASRGSAGANFYGSYSFNGAFTSPTQPLPNPVYGFADFLLGYTNNANISQPSAYSTLDPGAFLVYFLGPYIQDDWKVTPKLTVNAGLRYDFQNLPYEQRNHNYWLDLSNPQGGLCVADPALIASGLGGTIYRYCGTRAGGHANKTPFAPRFGFSYSADSKTAIRGGYGVFFDQKDLGDLEEGGFYPYGVTGSYVPDLSSAAARATTLTTDQLFPSLSAPGPVTTADLGFIGPSPELTKSPYFQQYSLSVQRELTRKTTLDVYYAGSVGTHLQRRLMVNQASPYTPSNPTVNGRRPYSNFGFVLDSRFLGHSNYNSFNVKVEHRSKDLTLLAAYTWSHALDDGSSASGSENEQGAWGGSMDSHRLSLDYGSANYNVPQRLVASFVYELPVGRGKKFLGGSNQFTNALLGGWQVNGIFVIQQAFPFSIYANDIDGLDDTFVNRANQIHSPLPSGFTRNRAHWFDTTAFVQPAAGTFGNSVRDVLRGPRTTNLDASLFKNFSYSDRVKVQLRLEGFNALNHPQFGTPHNNVSDPAFGTIDDRAGGRIVQLGGKFVF